MDTSKKAFASKLLKIKAIKLQPANPFTWASGWKSPFYCDNRKTLSYPELRNYVKLEIVHVILDKFPEVEAIRNNGCEVIGMVASYTYGFPVAKKAFKDANVELVTLTDYEHVVAEALETGYIAESDVELLHEWRKDPAHWNG